MRIWRCWWAFLIWVLLGVASTSANKDPFALRISCGARQNVQTAPTNTLWDKDFGYTGGRPGNATRPSYISPNLNTLRYFTLSDGPENCYDVHYLPNGYYAVRIFFGLVADAKSTIDPLFDISLDGTLIYSMKPEWSNVDDQSFVEALISISDTSVSSCFHSTGHGDPAILSIEILQVDENAYYLGQQWEGRHILRTMKRLSCGLGKPMFDEDLNGDHWGGDRFWDAIKTFNEGSDKAISTETSINQKSTSPNFYPEKLYQYAVISTATQPDITYSMAADPQKNYSIWLHFAEIDPRIQRKGDRVFDVIINGDIVFTDVDIIGLAGGSNAALVLNKTITARGRTLTITLRPFNGNYTIISAIEIFEVIPMEFRTVAVEVGALKDLKNALGLPVRFGWNGDPCVPQQHPWSGVDCQLNSNDGSWVIDGLGLDNQGLRGDLPDSFSQLSHLQNINLSWNSIHGGIPYSLGTVSSLISIDLSFNNLNGTIPESLGQLPSLQTLNLNGNLLSGRVPSTLGGRPLHRASFNFSGNDGLCGIPGLPNCEAQLSTASKFGIVIGAIFLSLLLFLILLIMWKRKQNIEKAKKIAAKEAPYAKARTHFVRDVQMTKTPGHDHRVHTESASQLLA